MHNTPAKDFEFLVPPPGSAVSAVRDTDFRPPPPSAPSFIVASVTAAAAPKAPEDSHTITLKILNGSKVLGYVVFFRACTPMAILNETRTYCVECARDDQSLGTPLANTCDLTCVKNVRGERGPISPSPPHRRRRRRSKGPRGMPGYSHRVLVATPPKNPGNRRAPHCRHLM
jgi:hypothetical protein